MASVAAFGPRDPGSNPGWCCHEYKLKIEFSQIIQVCGTLASTVTL